MWVLFNLTFFPLSVFVRFTLFARNLADGWFINIISMPPFEHANSCCSFCWQLSRVQWHLAQKYSAVAATAVAALKNAQASLLLGYDPHKCSAWNCCSCCCGIMFFFWSNFYLMWFLLLISYENRRCKKTTSKNQPTQTHRSAAKRSSRSEIATSHRKSCQNISSRDQPTHPNDVCTSHSVISEQTFFLRILQKQTKA